MPVEIDNILGSSGNNFQARVATYLRSKGWTVLISPYFVDTNLDKPREMDLLAEKMYRVTDEFSQVPRAIGFRLHIECKFIKQHTLFWFDEIDRLRLADYVNERKPFATDNAHHKEMHQLQAGNRVAKLFASQGGLGDEGDIFFKATNQVMNAFIANRLRRDLIPRPQRKSVHQLTDQVVLIQYPVIMCSAFDKLYQIDVDGLDIAPRPVGKNFVMEVNYAWLSDKGDQRGGYFLIDIVDFNKIDDFLAAIDGEAEAATTIA
jgi:hypothetical protein